MRPVVGILPHLGDRPPPHVLAGDRPHVLAVAVPAALALVHLTAELLLRAVGGRLVPDPLDVTEVVPHRPPRPGLARLRDGDRQDALDEDRQGDAQEAGAQRIGLHEAWAGRAPGAATGRSGAPAAAGAIAVRMKL